MKGGHSRCEGIDLRIESSDQAFEVGYLFPECLSLWATWGVYCCRAKAS